MPKRIHWIVVTWVAVFAAHATLAQEPQSGSGGAAAGVGSLLQSLIPPDLVLQHASEIDLDDLQRQAIIAEIQRTQSAVAPLRSELREEAEKLRRELARPRIVEKTALEQAAEITELEGRLKTAHLALLIRIRNTLRPEQRSRLESLRGSGS